MASSIFIGFLPGVPYSTSGTTVTFTGTVGATVFLSGNGTAANVAFGPSSDPETGLRFDGADGMYIGAGGTARMFVSGTAWQFPANQVIGWTSGNADGTVDVSLSRGAANLLQLASGDSLKLVSGVLTGGGVLSPLVSVLTDNTAGVIAYSAAQVVGGLILRDCNGAGRADTVPTASALLAVLPGAQVGQAVRFTVRNTSGTAVSITVTAPDASVTVSGTMTIAQNNSKDFLARFTNVTAASEAYTLYSLGTVVF